MPPIPGVKETCHTCSHHGQNPDKIEQLRRVERAELQMLHDFVAKLKGSNEASCSLLDQTMVLYGSNLGNASSHDPRNLPILLFGGGFKHGQHLAFSRESNYPLPNLYVSMLKRMGIETDKFASSTGTMKGLELI